jgi:hypothetical protein
MLALPPATLVGNHVPQDLTHPSVQRCFAAVRVEVLERLAEGLLHGLGRRVPVAVEPREREPVKLRKELVEKLAESVFVARKQAVGDRSVRVHDTHVIIVLSAFLL